MSNLTGRMPTRGIQNPIPTRIESTTEDQALKMTVVGSINYIGVAAPGSLQSAAVWKCKKIDETTGMVITWADGDALYNNLATDLTILSYS